MLFNEARIYQDTVEIVKAAVTSDSQNNHLINANSNKYIADFIKTVYETLSEINKKP